MIANPSYVVVQFDVCWSVQAVSLLLLSGHERCLRVGKLDFFFGMRVFRLMQSNDWISVIIGR